MIVLQNLALRRGTQLLLQDVDLNIYAGQKLGVIGKNGAGKTSLFRLLMGELTQDAGDLTFPERIRRAWMQQETVGSTRRAVDYVLDGDGQFRSIERKLQDAEQREDFDQVARLHGELELIDGYTAGNRAEQLLSGLGFQPEEFSRTVAEFSGGWRIRLNLARALMMPSDLLLLDEPTNHLDLETTLWLQQWLQRYQGTLLLISHDRMFLDQVVGHVISFENSGLQLYRGNYSAYEVQKAERLAQQQAAYEKQQQRRRQIEDFVRRFRAKATKARQAQSRLKELDRMAEIAPAHVDSPFNFSFREADRIPESLLTCEKLEIGYDEVLIKTFSLDVRADSRLGLLGANGQGKSTLLKVLSGEMSALGGAVHGNDYLRVGYMAQHQVDALDTAASPLQLLQRLEQESGVTQKRPEQEMRDFLGGFDFRGDRISESIAHFSGGEKSRLALALVVWQKPNLLLLDEPTNHLDLEMRHALTVALQAFSGALIVVSHDRHLLNNTVDQFLVIRNRNLDYFDGSLMEYEKQLLEGEGKSPSSAQAGQNDRKQQRQDAARSRRQLKPLRDEVGRLERQIEKLQAEREAIEDILADPALYEADNKDRLNELLQEQGRLGNVLEEAETRWLSASEELERKSAAAS